MYADKILTATREQKTEDKRESRTVQKTERKDERKTGTERKTDERKEREHFRQTRESAGSENTRNRMGRPRARYTPCKFHAAGNCIKGDQCLFLHEARTAPQRNRTRSPLRLR
jgi:hypothetical protein